MQAPESEAMYSGSSNSPLWVFAYNPLPLRKYEDAEAAGFFLQQSVEKYIKAFLLQRGWNLRKIHELDALLDDAVKYEPELKHFYGLCERISGYYFADRYPPLVPSGLTCGDIEKDVQEAKRFIKTMFPEEEISA